MKFFIAFTDGDAKESLHIDKASLFETFGSLKIQNFDQLLRKSMSSLSLL